MNLSSCVKGRCWPLTYRCLIMTKLALFFACGLVLQVSAGVFGQQITLEVNHTPLNQIMKSVQEQSGYLYLFKGKAVAQATISVNLQRANLEEALEQVLTRNGFDWTINGKTIVIRASDRRVETATLIEKKSQQAVSGTVKDEYGNAIAGATVAVKGTNRATSTDMNGAFTITVDHRQQLLVISVLGFDRQEVVVGDAKTIEVVLSGAVSDLEEVIVIGYGTTTRKRVAGAVDQVDNRLIENRPVANITQALQGTAPSLTIQQRSMNPNDNTMNINIRGITSMNNNDPLIVIDGMIMNDVGSMNLLNPNDIESVSVLKDAGTSAIYGSRSANGVILITTKKGRLDMKPVITLNSTLGSQNPDILLKPVKGYQNALLRNDSYVNAGLAPVYTADEIFALAQGDSEWGYSAILKNALQQSHNLSVQGGSANTSYNLSFGYYDQESNFKGQDFGIKRYNFRSNLVSDIGRLKLTTLLAYNRQEGRSDRGGLWLSDAMRVPTYNMYSLYPDEQGRYYNNNITNMGNYLATLYHGGLTTTDNDHFQGIVSGDLDIWNGLTAKAVIGYDLRPEHRLIKRAYYPVYDYQNRNIIVNESASNDYSIEDYNGKITMLNTQFLLDYNRTFANVHQVTGIFGFTTESYRSERNEIKRFFVDDFYQDTDETVYSTDSYNTPNGFGERALYSWLGRIGYSYGEKYYAEVSGRYDGSSRFADGRRWGFFPSVSLGWWITEENFFSFWRDRIGDLKIRGSYGVLGSQSVDDYQFLTTYEIYQNQYGFNNTSVTGTGYTFGNALLTWEKTATFNIGVDASFFKNTLNVSYDFFNKYTTDILLTPQTPKTLGGAVPKANIGEMRNLGWELSVNYRLHHGDFTHLFGANIGDSFNKVMKYGDQEIAKSDEIERIIREGVPLYSYFGFRTAGLFQNYEEIRNAALPIGANVHPGDVRYVDRNGDGIIDDNDRFILGNAFPRYVFGFNYSFEWKGLGFSMLWQGVGKRDMALRGEMTEPFHGDYYRVMFEHQLDYWHPGNTGASRPRLVNNASPSYAYNYGRASDLNVYDAAYARLKDIQIGYSLPTSLANRLGASRIRVYASGQNLLTFTKNGFIDPESSEFGNSMNAAGANSGRNYPTLKYYGGGLELQF